MSSSTALTLKRQPWRSSQLLAVLEECWQPIAILHPTLPDAVFTIGAGELASGQGLRLGRFSPCSWQTTNDELPEVFIGAEGLARGPGAILATALHEAAHGLAHATGIRDTSRGGRYHNRRYRTLAENVGLEVTHHPQLGWSVTRMTDLSRQRYARQLQALEGVLAAHRRRRRSRPAVASSGRNLSGCGCRCGRRIRASASTLAQAAIICSRCGQPFLADPKRP